MSLHDAMRPDNGDEVSKLIQEGCDVNAKNSFGLTVIQHAANIYSSDIGKAGNLTGRAQALRTMWRQTINPIVATNKVKVTKVTEKAWGSSSSSGLPTTLDVSVDAMLHELGFYTSEIAQQRGYRCYF
jgi:hypothetical protein